MTSRPTATVDRLLGGMLDRITARQLAARALPEELRAHHAWFSELYAWSDEAAALEGPQADDPAQRRRIEIENELRTSLRARLVHKLWLTTDRGCAALIDFAPVPLPEVLDEQVRQLTVRMQPWLAGREDDRSMFVSFFHFANGDLRCPGSGHEASRHEDRTDARRFHAEPDGRDFFLFAELALTVLQSSRTPIAGSADWLRLARCAVATQPVYLEAYRPSSVIPASADYHSTGFRAYRRTALERADGLWSLHEHLEPAALEIVHVQNALALFHRERLQRASTRLYTGSRGPLPTT